MKIKEIHFRNILSYGNRVQSINFEQEGSLNLVLGKNGHGKSSIRDAITFALYGKVKNRKNANLANRTNGHLWTKIYLENRDREIVIERGINPNLFIVTIDGDVQDKSAKKDIDKWLEDEVFGLSFKMFNNLVSINVDNFESFLTMSPSDRRLLFDKLNNIDILQIAKLVIKEKMKELKTGKLLLEKDFSILENDKKSLDVDKQIIEKKTIENVTKTEMLSVLNKNISSKNEELSLLSENISNILNTITKLSENLTSKQNEIKLLEMEIDSILKREKQKQESEINLLKLELNNKISAKKIELEHELERIESVINSLISKKEEEFLYKKSKDLADIDKKYTSKINELEYKKLKTQNELDNYLKDTENSLQNKIDTLKNKGREMVAIAKNNYLLEYNTKKDRYEFLKELENKPKEKCPHCGEYLCDVTDYSMEKKDIESFLDEHETTLQYISKGGDFISDILKEIKILTLEKDGINTSERSIFLKTELSEIVETIEANKALLEKTIRDISTTYLNSLESFRENRTPEIISLSERNMVLLNDSTINDITKDYEERITVLEDVILGISRDCKLVDNEMLAMSVLLSEQNYLILDKKLKEDELERIKQEELYPLEKVLNGLKKDASILTIEIKGNESFIGLKNAEIETKSNNIQTKELELKRLNMELVSEMDAYDYIDKNLLSDSGIRKMLMSSFIDSMNVEIDELLSTLDIDYSVRFTDELVPILIQNGKIIDDMDGLSRGETKKIDLAIILTIFKILKGKYNGINILFFDELLSSLDVEVVDNVIEMLNKYAKTQNTNCFLVHHSQLNKSMFDKILKVEKTNGFSNISFE